MKKFVVLCAMFACVIGADARATTTNALRVLFIGNSFTVYNNLPALVAQLAATNGRRMVVERLAKGGANFQQHCEMLDACNRIASGAWDVVVLQNHSSEPLRDPSNMFAYGRLVCDTANDSEARTVLFLTWAYAAAPNDTTSVINANMLPRMQDRLNEAYYQMAFDSNAEVAPVGRAFAAVRAAHPEWPLHVADHRHPSPLGSYLAAITLYTSLYGELPAVLPRTFIVTHLGNPGDPTNVMVTLGATQVTAFTNAVAACMTNDIAQQYVRAHPRAGTHLEIELPELPPTLMARATGVADVPRVSIFFPRNYTMTRTFPLLIFLKGSTGGNGRGLEDPRRITRERDFICMTAPLFKNRLEPLNKKQSNYWMRLALVEDDSDVLWSAYRHLLPRVFNTVTNIDRRRVFFGGFSNGGHATAILLNRSGLELTNYADKFYFIEGGNSWTNAAALRGQGCAIVLQGGQQNRDWLMPMFTRAHLAGMPIEFVRMSDVGHGLGREGRHALRDWLYRNAE